MTFRKILVIYKKSALQLAKERKNEQILTLLENNDESVASYKSTHNAHVSTLTLLKKELSNPYFTKVDFRYRANANMVNGYDLVIAAGGDGTFLWASKFIGSKTPILGINTAPDSSVGFYTCANEKSIPALIENIMSGASNLPQKIVNRLKISVNQEKVQDRVLNDVLFAALHPAAMTRYILKNPDNGNNLFTEEQKSSGIWISTACGSTGANLSAGGWPLKFDDTRCQYTVREPMKNFMSGAEYKLIHGFFEKPRGLEIICKTRKAILACDGTTITIPVTIGDRINVSQSDETLLIMGK